MMLFRQRLILVTGFVFLGLGPALAQHKIYVDPNANNHNSRESGPSIYIRQAPVSVERRSSSRGSRYIGRDYKRDKILTMQALRDANHMVDVFYAWQRSDRTPRTIKEKDSYAKSARAVHMARMLKRRKVLISHYEKMDRVRARYAAMGVRKAGHARQRSRDSGDYSAFAPPALGRNSVASESTKTRSITITKPRIFVDPDAASNTDSNGVYTNYR